MPRKRKPLTLQEIDYAAFRWTMAYAAQKIKKLVNKKCFNYENMESIR